MKERGGETRPNLNMIYEFVCHDCKIVTDIERPVERAGDLASCPICNEPLVRIYHAPRVLNRHKPKPFSWDKKKMDAWDDRLAGFRNAESQGVQALKSLRQSFGEQVYQKVLHHKKENYA